MIGIWAQSFAVATRMDRSPTAPVAGSHRRIRETGKLAFAKDAYQIKEK
ncbi:hypothetical protein [Thioclava atlantica]|nr:hypothetical protein [Thioclava atlantica]